MLTNTIPRGTKQQPTKKTTYVYVEGHGGGWGRGGPNLAWKAKMRKRPTGYTARGPTSIKQGEQEEWATSTSFLARSRIA